jgi:GWxTD domain-containing protein
MNGNNSASFYFSLSTQALNNVIENHDIDVNLYIKYILHDIETKEIVDSNTYSYRVDFEKDFIIDSFNIKVPDNKEYRFIANLSGIPSVKDKRILANINNTSTHSPNNFMLKKIDSVENITYNNFVSSNNTYKILSNNNSKSSCNIEYYKSPEYSVIPPYSTNYVFNRSYTPSSLYNYKIGDTISFREKGFYLLKFDGKANSSMCILNYGNNFPLVTTVGDMLSSLQLVASAKDFNKVKDSDNIKLAIDQYWFSRSDNQGFAKEQIRVYYNRIQLANLYFSDNIEGWKTDRGNIYVIFGAPSIINITTDSEEWFYGENPNIAGLLFIFKKVDNQYSENSYELVRDVLYQSTWGQAISTWRKGRVFSITK